VGRAENESRAGDAGEGVVKVLSFDQRTDAWRLARAGRLTSSRVADMCATIPSGESAGRRNLRTQLVLERLTGTPQEPGFISAAMRAGLAKEPLARVAYEAQTGLVVHRVGFAAHDTLLAGCSPDGEIDDFEGLVELKCGLSATHLAWLKTGAIPLAHMLQLTHQLWITGAGWIDYVSFDDKFPPRLQLGITRVERREVDLRLYELNVRAFLGEVDREVAEVGALADERAIA
jgi:hypothetical protein